MASSISSASGAADLDIADIRAYSLGALVKESDASVRLFNSITVAAKTGKLPLRTVGEYMDAGAHAEAVMLRDVHNFGRKTARELSALVRDVLLQVSVTSEGLALDLPAERNSLLVLLANDKIGVLASEEILSVRLTTLLTRPDFIEKSLAEVLDDFELTTADLRRLPNCGRVSVDEFRRFCHRHAVRRFHAAGHDDGDAIFSLLLSGQPIVEAVPPALSVAGQSDPSATPEHSSLADRLEWLMSDLPPREQAILRRRNGIMQQERETLEEIGFDFKVTRERIRQVEAKSLKRMAVHARRAPLRGFILAEAEAHWDRIAGAALCLRGVELLDARRQLDPHLRLACEIEGMSLEAWLNLVAHPFPFGWLSPCEDRAKVEEAAERIGDLAGLPIPLSLAGLAEPEDLVATGLAVELVRNVNVLRGYLMPRRVGARSTRLVRLHAILASANAIFPIERLLDRYRQLHDDDLCHERDAEIVMGAAPHLFLEIEDGFWAAISRPGVHVEPDEAIVTARSRVEEAGTIAHALQSTLNRRGPTRLSELMGEAESILPDGRSVNSIGPVLLTRRDLFVRALPGIYALHGQIAPLAASVPEDWPVLFNDVQARLYVLARYAGEPREIFPLWSAATERALCRWARHSGGPGILGSLLSVAVLEDWPCDGRERDEWRRLRSRQGRYELGSSLRHESAYELPDLDRVFAACRYVAVHGTFNYCAANRLTGRRLDSHVGAGLVAVLLRLGALEETSLDGFRWQRSHRAAGAVEELLRRFEQAFARAVEVPDWSSALGRSLSDDICAECRNPTWVDAEALSGMFDGTASATFDESDDDPLAQLMVEQRRAREAERRKATLDWLLTQ